MGAVSYLNTKPLTFGFDQGLMADEINLVFDYPSNIARGLLDGSIDIGLVPVAVIPSMAEAHILPGYCIGAAGEVASVALFSDVPPEQIETVPMLTVTRSGFVTATAPRNLTGDDV